MVWEEELKGMKVTIPQDGTEMPYSSSEAFTDAPIFDYDKDYGEASEHSSFHESIYHESEQPRLNPKFMTIRTRSPKSTFRTLSEITKATQGVIVLLCSQRSLLQVFQSAQQLGMLDGDYIFILAGQYNQVSNVTARLE